MKNIILAIAMGIAMTAITASGKIGTQSTETNGCCTCACCATCSGPAACPCGGGCCK